MHPSRRVLRMSPAVPADTQLSAEQAAALLSGGMYFNAHSAAFAPGEIRGQLIAQ